MSGPVQVPDKVLSWLYSSLNSEYHDPSRAYSDVAKTLSQHPSLSPRTDIFTYENGTSALLLRLHGTLPVTFRGTGYKYPISIWLPHTYPYEPPIPYFSPSQSLVVRPGPHVSMEGRVYHPYLAQWRDHWDRSNLIDCLAILQVAFAKEPPLVARSPQASGSSHSASGSLATAQGNGIAQPVSIRSPAPPRLIPPAPPPKPPEVRGTPKAFSSADEDFRHRASEAPPRPPKPGQASGPMLSQTYPSTPLPPHVTSHEPISTNTNLPATLGLPYNYHAFSRASQPSYQEPPRGQPEQSTFTAPAYRHDQTLPASSVASMHAQQEAPFQAQQASYHYNKVATQPTPGHARQPIPDLLSLPLEMALPSHASQSGPVTAPPIPPNPEKDALLQAISTTLRTQVEQTVAQNQAAIPALEAQRTALQHALQNMQAEKYQLDELNKMLGQNEKILRESMLEADRVVEGVQRRELPSVDEVLVAPTVVGEQLYKLTADERSIGDALFALTKALDRGRISSDVFLKQTRSLAREQFLQKALIKKVARGMGLAVDAY